MDEADAFDEIRYDHPSELEVFGDRVLSRQHVRARGSGSGIVMEIESWAVWTFDEDGLVVQAQAFLEHEEERARGILRGDDPGRG